MDMGQKSTPAEKEIVIDENTNSNGSSGDIEYYVDSNEKRKDYEFVEIAHLPVKVEINSDAEDVEIQLSDEIDDTASPKSVTEQNLYNDPMNLLEPTDERPVDDDNNYVVESNDGGKIRQWWSTILQNYDWLFPDEEDNTTAYCLYCDMRFGAGRRSFVDQHLLSLYHKEREKNYLAFKDFQKSKGDTNSNAEDTELNIIKDKDGDYTALKIQRKNETEALIEFNWSRWLNENEWLVRREQDSGTVGTCKYCRIDVNVEFDYMRRRHQDAKTHKAVANLLNDSSVDDSINQNGEIDNSIDYNEYRSEEDKICDEIASEWWEEHPDNPKMAICGLCRIEMNKRSFARHLKSQNHIIHEMEIKESNSKMKTRRRSWLISYANNPIDHFCLYCNRPFLAAFSESKKKQHEEGIRHRLAKEAYEKRHMKKSEQNGNETSSAEEYSIQSIEDAEENVNNAKNISRRVLRGSDAWFDKLPWAQRISDNPDCVYCLYCKKSLSWLNLTVSKHSRSQRHIDGKNKYLQEQEQANKMNNSDNNESLQLNYAVDVIEQTPQAETSNTTNSNTLNENDTNRHEENGNGNKSNNTTKTFYNSITEWKQIFPWLKRIENRNDYGYCKYCDESIYVPSIKQVTKHQNSLKHLRERRKICTGLKNCFTDNLDRSGNVDENEMSNSEGAKQDELDSYWKNLSKQFPWILPTANLSNKGQMFCKFCKIQLTMNGITSKIRHQNTLVHRNAVKNAKTSEDDATGECDSVEIIDEPIDVITIKSEESDDNENENWSRSPKRQKTKHDEPTVTSRMVREAELYTKTHHELLELTKGLDRNCRKRIIKTSMSLAASLSRKINKNYDLESHHHPSRPMASTEDVNAIQNDVNRTTCRNSCSHLISNSSCRQLPNAVHAPVERNAYDLFFESISETVKKLPTDLAAEGRMKVMQLIYDLEVRALRRDSSSGEIPNTSDENNQQQNVNSTESVLLNGIQNPEQTSQISTSTSTQTPMARTTTVVISSALASTATTKTITATSTTVGTTTAMSKSIAPARFRIVPMKSTTELGGNEAFKQVRVINRESVLNSNRNKDSTLDNGLSTTIIKEGSSNVNGSPTNAIRCRPINQLTEISKTTNQSNRLQKNNNSLPRSEVSKTVNLGKTNLINGKNSTSNVAQVRVCDQSYHVTMDDGSQQKISFVRVASDKT